MTSTLHPATSAKWFQRKSWYPWMVVGLLWVVALLNYMDRQMLSTMREAMGEDISQLNSTIEFGKVMAAFMWIYAFMSPVSGIVADRVNRKWLIVISLGVWSAVTLLIGFATTFEQVYWLRAAMGVSEALYIPAALSLIADYFTGKQLSLAIGIHMTGLYMGQAVGGFGAAVAHMLSWQVTFHWFGIIGLGYGVILTWLLHEKRKSETAEKLIEEKLPLGETIRTALKNIAASLGMLLGNVGFWTILFFFASCSVPGWSTKNWLPELFASSLGIDIIHAGPIATITIAVSSFFGVMIGGPLADAWARRNLKGRIYTSAIGLGLMIPALVFMGFGHSMFAAISAGILFGVGYGLFDANNMPILCQFVPDRQRGTAYGIMNMAGLFIGALATNYLGELAAGGQMGLGFAMMAAALVLAVILQLTLLRPTTLNQQ